MQRLVFFLLAILSSQISATTLVDSYLYEGNEQESFQGDQVFILDDGSHWKIHPSHGQSVWPIGETITLDVRERNYWLKREHHFLLKNSEQEVLKAMLLEYGEEPLTIAEVKVTYPKCKLCHPKFTPEEKKHFMFRYLNSKVRESYRNVTLSDGRIVSIRDDYNDFIEDEAAYLGQTEEGKYFLIIGLGKDQIWDFCDLVEPT